MKKALNLYPSKCQVPNHSWVDWGPVGGRWKTRWKNCQSEAWTLGPQALSQLHHTPHTTHTPRICVHAVFLYNMLCRCIWLNFSTFTSDYDSMNCSGNLTRHCPAYCKQDVSFPCMATTSSRKPHWCYVIYEILRSTHIILSQGNI